MLNLSRAVQGVGGAIMFATSLALIAQAFQGRERGTAVGIYGAVVGGAVAIGPLIGGNAGGRGRIGLQKIESFVGITAHFFEAVGFVQVVLTGMLGNSLCQRHARGHIVRVVLNNALAPGNYLRVVTGLLGCPKSHVQQLGLELGVGKVGEYFIDGGEFIGGFPGLLRGLHFLQRGQFFL